jgi:photosystem II stability/assembly factor-like uncharacterized protein
MCPGAAVTRGILRASGRPHIVLPFLIVVLVACQGSSPAPAISSPTSFVTPISALTGDVQETEGNPPGPVLALAPLPNGESLAGVGPVGDVDTDFEWQLFRGHDDQWQPLAWPAEANPRSLSVSPSGDLIFAVPFSNAIFGRGQAWGLMRSSSGGDSWQQSLKGLRDPYVMDLAFSPAFETDHTMFVVTWYSGVHFSTDAGESWQLVPYREEIQPSGGASPYDLALAVSPDFLGSPVESEPPAQGMVMASFARRLHRWDRVDGGWRTVALTVTTPIKGFEPSQAQLTAGAIAFSPGFADDGTLYLYSGYAGLFRSTDRGETWRSVNRGLPSPSPLITDYHLAVASATEVYVLLFGPRATSGETVSGLGKRGRTLYRTRDAGASWEALLDPPTLGDISALALTRDEKGQVILHLGGSRGGVSSHATDTLHWD